MHRKNDTIPALFLALLLTVMQAGPAGACGSHDPSLIARGSLNHVYPNSLHIIGAIQRARFSGELPPFDRDRFQARGEERQRLGRIAFEQTLSALHAIGTEMARNGDNKPYPDIAIVVLDNLLWTRFSSDYFDVRQGLHVKGPAPGDVVLVTDEPVVRSIQSGSMSIERAIELGVLRFYGPENQMSELLASVGRIGEAPLRSSVLFAWSDFDGLGASPFAQP